MVTEDFVVGGTCSEQLYGMCESLWRPDMVSQLLSYIMSVLFSSMAVFCGACGVLKPHCPSLRMSSSRPSLRP